jgi:hypothetical protein
VFTNEGTCVAHGLDAGHVGLTLAGVLRRLGVRGAPADLNAQFVAAAQAGGGWVQVRLPPIVVCSYRRRRRRRRRRRCLWSPLFVVAVGVVVDVVFDIVDIVFVVWD